MQCTRHVSTIILAAFLLNTGCSTYRWVPPKAEEGEQPQVADLQKHIGERVKLYLVGGQEVVLDVTEYAPPLLRGLKTEKVKGRRVKTEHAVELGLIDRFDVPQRYTTSTPAWIIGGLALVIVVIWGYTSLKDDAWFGSP